MDIKLHLENHHAKSSAKYIKNIIYGGIDGIITTFSIIAACFGANLNIKYIIAMGFACLKLKLSSPKYCTETVLKIHNSFY